MSSQRTLDEVRSDIDAIDDSIQDLLIRRTELVQEVRAIKHDWRVKIQPSREADIIYRLLKRHHGAFPKRDLVAIWRILICATLSFEGPFSVAVYLPPDDGGGGYWDLARDHFGPCTPMTRHGSVRSVIESVHRQDAVVGVLPLPRHDDADPWWRHLATSQPDAPKVIARLPFAGRGNARGAILEALAICPVTVMPTGQDRSLLAAECEQRLGQAPVARALQEAGFEGISVTPWHEEQPSQPWLYLIEVEGYVTADDPRLGVLGQTLGRSLNRVLLLGGYALPVPADGLGPQPAAAGVLPHRSGRGEEATTS
jgi:chorismate mutase / prephenate dehydratase